MTAANLVGATVATRIALRRACRRRKAQDLDLDLDSVYPEEQRHFPKDFEENRMPHEPYLPFQNLITGLGINLSAPRTRQEVLSVAAALPDRSQTEKVLKQVAKPIYILRGDLNSNTVQNMPPDRSRSQIGTDSSALQLTTTGIRAVKHEMRHELIVKRMNRSACMCTSISRRHSRLTQNIRAFICDADFIGNNINFNTFTGRHAYWVEKMEEIPSLLFWYWQPLGSVINLKFVFQEGDPETREGKRARRRQR